MEPKTPDQTPRYFLIFKTLRKKRIIPSHIRKSEFARYEDLSIRCYKGSVRNQGRFAAVVMIIESVDKRRFECFLLVPTYSEILILKAHLDLHFQPPSVPSITRAPGDNSLIYFPISTVHWPGGGVSSHPPSSLPNCHAMIAGSSPYLKWINDAYNRLPDPRDGVDPIEQKMKKMFIILYQVWMNKELTWWKMAKLGQ